MAFILNDLTLAAKHGLATLTLHETASGQNRVVYVIVPMPRQSRLTAAMLKKQATAQAKAALQAAAAVL